MMVIRSGDEQDEGSSSKIRAEKKSFAELLKGNVSKGDVNIKKPSTYCNKPAVIFSEEEEATLASSLQFALIGKFSRGLPTFNKIHPSLVNLGLRGSFTVGALKPGYILINPSLEEDFARLWLRQEWTIEGKPMRLFKWTPFTFDKESSKAPVWVNFPDLPVHLFAKGALFSVASALGKPLKVDEPTANRTRPSIARVCVEIDLLQPPLQEILIRCGKNDFVQKVFYENRPHYCKLCNHRGHSQEECYSNGKNKPPMRQGKFLLQQNQKTGEKQSNTTLLEKGKSTVEVVADKDVPDEHRTLQSGEPSYGNEKEDGILEGNKSQEKFQISLLEAQ